MHKTDDFQYDLELVIDWLTNLSDDERMILLNKYTRLTENIYCRFSAEENVSIISKIFNLKLSGTALVNTYLTADPIVNHPGCRLDDFIHREMSRCDYPGSRYDVQETLAA